MDWSRRFHGFRHFDGRECDWRKAKPGLPRASEEAWRTAPGVRREYWRGFRHGVASLLLGAVACAELVLALYLIGIRP